MSKWTQPKAAKAPAIEGRLAECGHRLNAWRIRIGTHYPATLRVIAGAFVAACAVAVTALMAATGTPLPISLTFGPMIGGLVGLIPAFLTVMVLFDFHYRDRCECSECEGDMR